jgi:hypothetical protein
MTDSQIIDLLGGPAAISRKLGISSPAVCLWRKTGIPADKRMRLAVEIEQKTEGKLNRKSMFPQEWSTIWPEI